MKKLIYLCLLCSAFFALEEDQEDNEKIYNNLVSARVGYFQFSDFTTRQLYENGTADIELENSFWFLPRYALWGNVGVIWGSGKTSVYSTKSEIEILTGSLGLKECFKTRWDRLELYLGLGITTAFIWIKDSSEFVSRNVNRLSAGCVGKSGFLLWLQRYTYLDAFFDYYYQPTARSDRAPDESFTVDLGGFRVGAAIGYYF